MKRLMNFALGLFFGAMVGAAWALLFASQSGSELRQGISERFQGILEEARQAGASRRAEIAAQFPITRSSSRPLTE